MNRLMGKRAVVTGAGAGIGRAIAIRYASEGAKVVVSDIKPETGEATVREILEAGGEATFVKCDVMYSSECDALVAECTRLYGGVDILVNNAGGAIVAGYGAPFTSYTDDDIARMIGVNLLGAIYLSRAVIPGMKAQGHGKIINMASITGVMGARSGILYATAKGGIIAFTKSLAMDLGQDNINVVSISPGAIATRPGPASLPTYMGRTGRAEEVAGLAAYLASDEADFITAQNYIIDGGRAWGSKGD